MPADSAATAAQDRRLEAVVGRQLSRPLRGGESHSYRLALAADQVVELVAEQHGVDLVLELTDPAGGVLITVDSPTGGSGEERLRAVTRQAGDHRVSLRASGKEDGGSYRLRLAELRQAEDDDRVRFAAEKLFAEAELLRQGEDRGSKQRAVAIYLQALDAYRELPDLHRQAEIEKRLGWVYRRDLDRKRLAVEHYRRAAALYEQLGDRWNQASTTSNRGRAHYNLGEIEAAREAYLQALPLWRQAGDEAAEAATLNNLALIYSTHGRTREALDFYDRAVARLEQPDKGWDQTRVLYNRGRFYRSMGKERLALDDFEQSLAVARSLDRPADIAAALTGIGRTLEQLGELPAARRRLEEAVELRRRVGLPRGLARALASLARVEAQLGRTGEALATLREAETLLDDREAPRDRAIVLAESGWLLIAAGRPDEALAPLHAGLALFTELGDLPGETLALSGLARAERALGDLTAALRHGTRALEQVERLRAGAVSLDLRASYLAHQQDPFDFLVDLLMQLDRIEPAAGHAAAALTVSERSRARSLLDSLHESGADLRRQADPGLLDEERELQRRLAALSLRRAEPPEDPGDPPAPELEEALDQELRKLLRRLDRTRSRIRAQHPRYADLTQPTPLAAGDIQSRLLDEHTALLEYDLGSERSYVWLVTADTLVSAELPPREIIDAAARRGHEALAASHQREAAGPSAVARTQLGELLLAPVAEALRSWAKTTGATAPRLLVVGDGALHYLPIGALPLPKGREPLPDAKPLLADFEIVGMPSASSLAVLRRRLAGRQPPEGVAAILADPVLSAEDPRLAGRTLPTEPPAGRPAANGLPRLAYSRREAEAIAALAPPGDSIVALGFDAHRELVTGGVAGGYRYLHLATHGELDSQHPELSRLVLSRFAVTGVPREGRLFGHQIYGLELPAELVTLSACHTALGARVRGEGLVGLTQAFFYAGAARLLVSLWQVDDEAAAALMGSFYRGLWQDGLPAAAALRWAQLEIRAQPRWRTPYYWAGFVLLGEWRPTAESPPPTKQRRPAENSS